MILTCELADKGITQVELPVGEVAIKLRNAVQEINLVSCPTNK